MTSPTLPGSLHLSDEQLAAFLDGRLTRGDRDDALLHFAACPACRREMAAVRRIIAVPRVGRRVPLIGLATALAAAVVFVMVPRGDRVSSAPGTTVRSPNRVMQPDRNATLTVVSPRDGAVVDSAVVFRWRAAGADATYRVTVQDQSGAVVWGATVFDTVATLPPTVVLSKGQQYFWSVDAQLADGGSAKAGARRFRVP